LLECKQDARIDEAGEAKVGWWESYSRGGEILADAAVKPTTPVEGTRMVCVALRQGSGSAFVYYETPRDFSAYANGYLEAELFGAADVEIGVSWIPAGSTTEQRNSVPAADYVVASAASGWKSIRIPLCVLGADLGRLKAIATFTVQQPASPITFCVDAIRFRKASSLCQATCGRSADFGTAETALRSL
jgi:hypothetical protein